MLLMLLHDMTYVLNDAQDGRRQRYNENGGKDEKHQREHELDGGLGGRLFRPLPPLGAQRIGKGPQSFGQRGPERLSPRKTSYES